MNGFIIAWIIHVLLPNSNGLTVKTAVKGVSTEVSVYKNAEKTSIVVTRDGALADKPLMDEGNDGVPDRMLYNNGKQEGWFRIAPEDAPAYQERYNLYLQAVLDNGYCQAIEEMGGN